MSVRKKMWLFFLFSVLAVLAFCFPVFAEESFTKQVMVELEAIAEEKDYFKPNESAGYKLTVKNKLGSAWIRVKFDLSGKNIDREFTDQDLPIQDGWVKRGGYFYYTKKAEACTDYLVVDGIRIPDVAVADRRNKEEKVSVTVSVYGEAIQYGSITPDFSNDTPWGEEKPQQTWIWKIFGDSGLGKWIYGQLGYRSYGSLYVNEKTPDGQRVNEAGIKE